MAIWHTRRRARNIESRLDNLRFDLQALRKEMRGVGDAASDVVRTTNRVAENALDSVGGWTNDNIGRVRDSVRKQPLAALVLCMAAGALVGALLTRR